MRKREHTGFVKLIATDEPSEGGEICHCIEAHESVWSVWAVWGRTEISC